MHYEYLRMFHLVWVVEWDAIYAFKEQSFNRSHGVFLMMLMKLMGSYNDLNQNVILYYMNKSYPNVICMSQLYFIVSYFKIMS